MQYSKPQMEIMLFDDVYTGLELTSAEHGSELMSVDLLDTEGGE